MSTPDDSRTATIRIPNRAGLHARPAASFVKLASQFPCEVRVRKDEMEVNGKSIMGVMMLAAEYGSEIVIQTTGEEADAALSQLSALVESGFGEE